LKNDLTTANADITVDYAAFRGYFQSNERYFWRPISNLTVLNSILDVPVYF